MHLWVLQVKQIIPGTIAARDGRMKRGDRILSVNGHSMSRVFPTIIDRFFWQYALKNLGETAELRHAEDTTVMYNRLSDIQTAG